MIKPKSIGRSLAITLWIIAGIYLLLVAVSLYLYLHSFSESLDSISKILKQVLLLPIAWTVLLCVEGIFYWRFGITYAKPYAWMHVICMGIAFVLSFLFLQVANLFVFKNSSHGDAATQFRIIFKIDRYIFWAFFMIGHIFFITAIVERFRKNNKTNLNEPDSGILDEFAD